MKVGDYVRTDKGEIGKLEDLKLDYTTGKRLVTYYTYKEVKENLVVFDNKNITQRFVDGSSIYLTDYELKNVEESIIKSSPNIIDLIEVGDVITYKTDIGSIRVQDVHNSVVMSMIKSGEIEVLSIVTKEQFSSMGYEVN